MSGFASMAGYRGGDGGLTSAERQRLKKSWNVKIVNCAAVTISLAASAYFAKAEFDRL